MIKYINSFMLGILASALILISPATAQFADLIVMEGGEFTAGPPAQPGHLMPEGVEFLNGKFYVGNIAGGDISRVSVDGTLEVITPAGSHPLQQSVFGLDMDPKRHILHVASAKFPADINASVQSAYLAINADTGEILRAVDLSDVVTNPGVPRRSNDLCFFDQDQNSHAYDVYITDSSSAQIWKVAFSGRVSQVAQSLAFNANPQDESNPLGIGLNGLVCHPSGYLLTARFGSADNSSLFKVGLNGSVREVEIVENADLFEAAGGLYLAGPGTLLVVVSLPTEQSAVLRLESNNAWRTARVVERVLLPLPRGDGPPEGTDRNGCVRAATGVIVDGDFFVNCTFTASIVRVPNF